MDGERFSQGVQSPASCQGDVGRGLCLDSCHGQGAGRCLLQWAGVSAPSCAAGTLAGVSFCLL